MSSRASGTSLAASSAARVTVEQRVEDDRVGAAVKGPCARRHLVHHDPEREEFGPGVETLAARLFRRHVGNRADGLAKPGRSRRPRRPRVDSPASPRWSDATPKSITLAPPRR